MDRRMLLGIAVLAGIITPSAWPAAAPRVAGGDTTFTVGWDKDAPTLRVEGRGVKFFKRVDRERVSIRLEVPGDVVELEAAKTGAVRIGRKGRFVRLQMKDNFEAGIAKVQKLMAGSKALDGLDGLVASLAANDSLSAQSLRSSHSLMNAVRGVTVSATVTPPASGRVRNAMFTTASNGGEGPGACWAEYAMTVNQYNYDFNECISDYWWIPGWTVACGFQWALQSELAFFWLLSCSGGMPV
jgi:hypothetical protein